MHTPRGGDAPLLAMWLISHYVAPLLTGTH